MSLANIAAFSVCKAAPNPADHWTLRDDAVQRW